MAPATLATAVDALTSTVDYLRITIGAPAGDGWLPCEPLVSDPDHLAGVVAATATARGTDRTDVATSLFVQGYAFRIATVAVGSWLLGGSVLVPDPSTTAIAIGRGRPNAVLLDPTSRTVGDATVADLHAGVIDDHLAPLVATAHRSARVGAPLLWGNVAASCAAAFGAFADAVPVAGPAATFFAAARPEVRDAGHMVVTADRFSWKRHSCCLWYRTDSGFMCEDCSLRSEGPA